MENASKALIIAGAILLSILIIALGIYVFNMAKGSFNGDQLSEMEKNSFNSQFTAYEGKQVGTTVKALLDKIIVNCSENNGAQDRLPKVYYHKGKGTYTNKTMLFNVSAGASKTTLNTVNNGIDQLNLLRMNLVDNHFYNVKCQINGSGLVEFITIEYDT